MRKPLLSALLAGILFSAGGADLQTVKCDLLIVGATESGWAAAIQAARSGVKSIVIVHDGVWFGGQFTEQALACVDENKGPDKVGWGVDWHPMKRSFHRSGLFKELMDRIEAFNTGRYGSPMPGRPWHGPSTFRPAEAESVFRKMIAPYIEAGQVSVFWKRYPTAAAVRDQRLTGLTFSPVDLFTGKSGPPDLSVEAKITIDASDWGDAVRASGAAYFCGPDPAPRFGEASAPPDLSDNPRNEMNPITWAMIVAESDVRAPLAEPPRFDDRCFPRATRFSLQAFRSLPWDVPNPGLGAINHWPDAGKEAERQLSVYSVRRIVEGSTSADGRTSILLNYMNGQDYPLERLPRHVVDALEATEAGASEKNIAEMTRLQRQIVFDDAKRHSQCVLYHLQNFVHQRAPDQTNSFRNFHLSDEFGTPDHLPPKPYIRESLRLRAMYMMREQDGRNRDSATKNGARPRFAKVMYPDGLFAWQFHYDFHRTGRTYLKDEGNGGPWIDYHKPNRHTKFISDRAVFPLRSLIPEKLDGLLGSQGNLGFSSIVSAAIRLHDQRIHAGQAAGAVAAVSLRESVDPRQIVFSRLLLERVRSELCPARNDRQTDGSAAPLLLWPFRDLPAGDPNFEAINRLGALGVIPHDSLEVDFRPDDLASTEFAGELRTRLEEICPALSRSETDAPSRANRGELCAFWWREVCEIEENQRFAPFPGKPGAPEDDADGDGIMNRDDALLFSPNEPVVFQIEKPPLTPETDGIPPERKGEFFFHNFEGSASGEKFNPGKKFGWQRDLARNFRAREKLDGPRDSFVFTRAQDQWSFLCENGLYRITVCVGDSGHEQTSQSVWINGQPLLEKVNTSPGRFAEAETEIEVDNAKIDVLIGSQLPGSNTCVNWILIENRPR